VSRGAIYLTYHPLRLGHQIPDDRTIRRELVPGYEPDFALVFLGRANGSDVKLQAAFTPERTRGAPLAAMHAVLTLSVCKRRDAVRLARNQPARPAGAAFGGLSASAAS
jgi:hypothetical protein